MAITPLARGLTLCERVVVDPVTTNLTLEDCFRAVRVDQFPGLTPPFFVVAHLVNGLGDLRVRVVVLRLDTNQIVYQFATPVSFGDRLGEVRYKLEIGQCVIPSPGVYAVMLWANDEYVAQNDFTVLAAEGIDR